MKLKSLIGGLVALALATAAQAVTIDLTGATAFRTAAVNTIIAAYGNGLTDVAHSGGNNGYTGAQYSIFQGNFPGIGAGTIIRCTWTGSVEGVRDVALGLNQNFLTAAAFSAGTAGTAIPLVPGPGTANQRHTAGNGSSPAIPKLAFSDVFGNSTPYDTSALTDDTVGILVFCMVANEGAPAGLSNITTQQFRALWSAGEQRLSLFTGVASDTTRVFATGRNDFSGTRTHYLAESGVGFATPVIQWKPVTTGSGATLGMSSIQTWPVLDGVNSSGVWNGDIAGNGGFNSSGNVASALQAVSTAVQRKNEFGTNIGAPTPVLLLSSVGINDALTITGGGGKALTYNGVGITPANPLSSGDVAKITNGAYTHWSYEHLFSTTTLTPAEDTFYTTLLANITANLGSAGIDVGLMNVSRSEDGGLVGP
jgi:hypothetical protein